MDTFDNWRTCVESNGFLTRINHEWVNPLGETVVTISKPINPCEFNHWALIAYCSKSYRGELLYSLYAFKGNDDVGEFEEQLATVLHLQLPPTLDVDILTFGRVYIEDSGEGSLYLIIGDTEIAELWVEPSGDYGFKSDLLDKPSLDYLYKLVGSITDVDCPARPDAGWK